MSTKVGTAIAIGLGSLFGGTVASMSVRYVAPKAKFLQTVLGVVGAAVGGVAGETLFPYTPPPSAPATMAPSPHVTVSLPEITLPKVVGT